MEQAKHMKSSAKKSRKTVRVFAIVLAAVIVLTAAIVTAAVLLKDTSSTVTEELTQAEVTCAVNADYSVTNTGNVPALIRVRVIVNKTESDEIIPGELPTYTVSSDWTQIGNYLYYNGIVSNEDGENDTTAPISFSTAVDDAVQVLVLAEAIQAAAEAAEESWGVSFTSGSWS